MKVGVWSTCSFVSSLLLPAAFWPRTTHAWMPPHPDYTEFEPVHLFRQRLNITYNYDPEFIHPETCRNIPEHECELYDEQARKHQEYRRLNPQEGEYNILVLPIVFPEDRERNLTTVEHISEILNGEGPSPTNPIGSVRQWLYYASMGKYRPNFVVLDWDTAPKSGKDYAAASSGILGPVAIQDLFRWRLEKLDAEGFDFSVFDADFDYWLDGLIIIHSGLPAEIGYVSCGDIITDRLWSQATGTPSGDWKSVDQYELQGYAIVPGWGVKNLCDRPPMDIGIVTHEFNHGFGMEDLYNQDTTQAPTPSMGGVARFDMMANSYGWFRNASVPGSLSPYSRQIPGWVTPMKITRDGYYALQPSEVSSTTYRIDSGFPSKEYLLIENRQPIKFDSDWPEKGIVIYHVDESKNGQRQRGYPGHPDWPAYHYKVAVLQADRNYDLERGNNIGDEGDFWKKGDVLGPSTGPDDWPNTDSYQNGQVPTGVKITVINDPGLIAIIKVEGIAHVAGAAPGLGLVPVDPLDAESIAGQAMEGANTGNPGTAGKTLAWILSLIGGVAALIGLAVFILL